MAITRQLSSYFAILLATLVLAACSSKAKKDDPYFDWPADEIYQEANKSLNKKRYSKAVAAYESLDAQYPFGDYTEKAHLNIIYAYYRFNELPAAMRAADRYIKLHPRSAYLDYVYYMRGLIKSTEGINFLARYTPMDLTQRDTSSEQESFAYFEDFLKRFPESEYAPDARQRLIALRNNLAQQQLNIAEYYMRRGAYLAAANRGQGVVEHYPQTPAVRKSLAIMTVAYEQLNMPDLSNESKNVLSRNATPEEQADYLAQAHKLLGG